MFLVLPFPNPNGQLYSYLFQPVYHEPYGARSPTTREAATLQIAVGRKGKREREREEETLSIKAIEEEKRPPNQPTNERKLLWESCANRDCTADCRFSLQQKRRPMSLLFDVYHGLNVRRKNLLMCPAIVQPWGCLAELIGANSY